MAHDNEFREEGRTFATLTEHRALHGFVVSGRR